MKNKIQILALLFMISTCSVNAQTGNTDNKKKQSKTTKSKAAQLDDKQFAKEAAKGGMKEVNMGNDAKDKATNERVKNYGAMMARDHTKANEDLKSIMNKENIEQPPKETGVDHMLQNKTGVAYDKLYMKMMVADHIEDIAVFENESRNGKDAELKAFAYRMLPTLKMHLDSARAIQSSLKAIQPSSK